VDEDPVEVHIKIGWKERVHQLALDVVGKSRLREQVVWGTIILLGLIIPDVTARSELDVPM
jgi:hypothetical protein